VPARAELTLAALGLINHCSADSLRALASARGVSPDETWNVYSFATALIEPGAVWNQLSHLDRETLIAVDQLTKSTGGGNPSLPWGIGDTDSGGLRPEVNHAIDSFSAEWTSALAGAPTTTKQPIARDNVGHPDGLTQSLPRMVDTLDELRLVLTLVAHNDITQRTPSIASLVKALGQLSPEISADWSEAVEWGVWSRLLVHQSGSWWVSDLAFDFVDSDRATQLATLVTLWWETAGVAVQDELAVVITDNQAPVSLPDHIRAHFPLLDTSTLGSFFERGHKLGAFSGDRATSLIEHLIAGDDLVGVLTPLMPPAAPGVYLDGVDSVVGAGPLTREQQDSLGLVARCVRGGMTPRWIVDRDSVLASLSNTSAATLCDRLGTVIIGGVPDTLHQQLVDWEARAQSLTLVSDFPGTLLHCRDNYLSELLQVDQKLQTLHLARVSDTSLSSKRGIAQTRQVLLDAGYPTFPGDVTPHSPRVLKAPRAISLPDSWWDDIIARAKDMPTNAVWTEDVLRDAIAERTLLSLTVRIADGQRHMVVEPRSIARGRLRVKDTAADVERTLPLDTIVSIQPAQHPVT
jgi:hypothetical protein